MDKGNSFGATTDQRGGPRPFDLAGVTSPSGSYGSDMGAFELTPVTLQIGQPGTNVVVSWPAYAQAYRLQSTTNLTSASGWSVVSGTPLALGSRLYVTNVINVTNKFYRLVYP